MNNNAASISVAMITKNGERTLRQALEAIKWVDEIIVINDNSDDGTQSILDSYPQVKVIHQPFLGFSAQKQLAIDNTHSEWVLLLDDDEYLSEKLQQEIQNLLINGSEYSALTIPRTLLFLGHRMIYGNEAKRPILRLFRNGHARMNGKQVHEGLEVISGRVGGLTGVMWHDSFASESDCLHKMDRYAKMWAEEKYQTGKTTSQWYSQFKYALGLTQNYILGAQWMNGKAGWLWSQCQAHYQSKKYELLYDYSKLK